MRVAAYRLLPALAAVLTWCGTVSAADAGKEPSQPVSSEDSSLNLNIHLYGFSYHTDRQGVRRNQLNNEFNLGLGLNYEFHEDARGVGFVEGGFYRDSGSHVAKLAGVGYQFKLGERWRLGGALVGVRSATYNQGRFFVAPLPMVSYDFGAVKLNAVYVPRYGQYNQFAVFGFYFSIPFSR